MPRTQTNQRNTQDHERDWYDDPLTYDIVHQPGTAAEVRGLERIERRFSLAPREKGTKPLWFEPACGTARYLRAASKRGKRVLGIDLNRRMIAFARRAFEEEGLKGDLRAADMTKSLTRVKPATVDFAFCLINSIRHLPNDRSMLAHLRTVRDLLKPGAVYCVGIGLTHYGAEFPTEAVFTATRAGVRVTQLAQFLVPADRLEPVINHLTIESGRGRNRRTHHFTNTYQLRCYPGTQWTALVERAGFEIVGVVDEQGDDAAAFADGAYRRPDLSCYGLFVLRAPLQAPRRAVPSKQLPHRSEIPRNRKRPRASQRPA
ncbi:MAG: class I SAM-dependent methyltransferase [Phycisphaerales bacterium]